MANFAHRVSYVVRDKDDDDDDPKPGPPPPKETESPQAVSAVPPTATESLANTAPSSTSATLPTPPTPGAPEAPGASGTSGTSGTSAASGASGTSAASGTPGYSEGSRSSGDSFGPAESAGIGVGVALALLFLALGAWFFIRRRRKRRLSKASLGSSTPDTEAGFANKEYGAPSIREMEAGRRASELAAHMGPVEVPGDPEFVAELEGSDAAIGAVAEKKDRERLFADAPLDEPGDRDEFGFSRNNSRRSDVKGAIDFKGSDVKKFDS
ncbi:hypothetical protein GGP41_008026 [Bipolaris sorokiniana]|uniref:Uncharacterized protein n=2 Tax=Cochliobolus sativus TaxID=45130 RepID=A0A8H5ZND0_COCSA|nr:uncharacterized protein COCSADRAFT_24705 [Bipolaris sorokiniana ND90Pr]EMD66615.1 hypothetical protein COCSADRAFT_24705 [Bipolaris sorokiniana ND90Pr]KAF5852607.1 hypothetical protein GGP41_008026 [Bipolaris sorokiniana]